jgi:predicted CDP-diglyceride synthetase/phosphatidate cytidylyltransferase
MNFEPVYTIAFIIPALMAFHYAKKEFLKAPHLMFWKLVVMAFVLQMNAGPALSEDSLGSLKLRSSATVYLAVEWESIFKFTITVD